MHPYAWALYWDTLAAIAALAAAYFWSQRRWPSDTTRRAVFAVAPELGRRAARFTHPLVVLPLWLATYFVWHIPAIYDAALNRPHSLLHVEHLTYFVAGVLMWWPVVHGGYSDGVKAAYFFAVFAHFFARFLRTEQIAGVFSGSSR